MNGNYEELVRALRYAVNVLKDELDNEPMPTYEKEATYMSVIEMCEKALRSAKLN